MDGGYYDQGLHALLEDGTCCRELEREGKEIEDQEDPVFDAAWRGREELLICDVAEDGTGMVDRWASMPLPGTAGVFTHNGDGMMYILHPK